MGNYTPGQLAIYVVVALGVAAVVYIAAGAMGIAIPMWIIHIAVVCLVVVVAALAIRFIMSV